MSSLRRIQSSKANGARSKGPSTTAAKQRSSLNALRHGLCANCIVLDHESRENFLILLQQHIDRLQPADEVEFGMIEEMCTAYWRQRRAWSIETGLFDRQMALQPDGGVRDRMAVALDNLAASRSLALLQRYEARDHLMYQRSLRTLILLRTVKLPNEPSPISEHSPSAMEQPQPSRLAADSEPLGNASLSLPAAQAAHPGKPRRAKKSGVPV
jgi:hypothetical protein